MDTKPFDLDLLQLLANQAFYHKIMFPLQIMTEGMIFQGITIDFEAYMKKFTQSLISIYKENEWIIKNNPAIAQEIQNIKPTNPPNIPNPPVDFILLSRVHVLTPIKTPVSNKQVYWKIKLNAITGFALLANILDGALEPD